MQYRMHITYANVLHESEAGKKNTIITPLEMQEDLDRIITEAGI